MYLVCNRDENTAYVVSESLPEADWVRAQYKKQSIIILAHSRDLPVDTRISKKTEHANLNDVQIFLNVSTRERGNQMV